MQKVQDKSPAMIRATETIDMVEALMGGTQIMRRARAVYMPKFPAETDDSYEFRLSTATLYPAYRHTMTVMTGKPFARPITIPQDFPPKLTEYMADADTEGRKIDTIAADLFCSALAFGQSHAYVEYPKVLAGDKPRSVEDEKRMGLRPYVVTVKKSQILGFQKAGTSLSMVRFKERAEEQDGAFGVKEVDQIRVLEVGKWTTYRKREQSDVQKASGTGEEWFEYESGPLSAGELPFVTFYAGRTAFMESDPPMKELAYQSIKHWQSQSDQDTLTHVARVPLLSVSGVDDTFELTMGTKAAVKLPVGAVMQYVEHSGAAIGAGKVSLDDLKEEMRQAGAELLVARYSTTKTATEVGAEESGSKSDLQRMTQEFEDTLNVLIGYMATMAQEKVTDKLVMFKEFGVLESGHATAPVIMTAQTGGLLSKESAYEELQRRGVISPNRKWDEEADRIDGEGPPVGNVDPIAGLPYKDPVPPQAPPQA